MKATELRIGNIVDYFGKEAVVTKVEKQGAVYYIGAVSGNLTIWNVEDSFEGVPITEEKLVELGFEKESYRMAPSGKFSYRNGGFSFYTGDQGMKLWSYYMYHIKYVHQLQNSYLAINNEELKSPI